MKRPHRFDAGAAVAALRSLSPMRAMLIGGGLLLLLILLLWMLSDGKAGTEVEKPRIAYMSSLPLAFGEADMAATVQGEGSADPFFVRLNERYRMEAIDDLEKLNDVRPDALLLVQPRALSAHENVALDRWVRAGGEMLMLADPALTRESRYPLGDKRRPLFTSMASPLLAHWGLELVLPMDEATARVERSVDGDDFETRAPGAFRKLAGKGGAVRCGITDDGFVARCVIGEGVAILIADADLIDPAIWQESGMFGAHDEGVELVEAYLAELTGGRR